MWQDEIPHNLPRQRIHQDVVREGTRRRRQRRSLQGLVAALVLLLAAAPAVLLDGRRDDNTTLVAGPATQPDEVPTSVTPSNGPTTEVERSVSEVDEPAKAQRKPPTPPTPPTTAATRSPQPGAGGSEPTAVATPPALASCDRVLVREPTALELTTDASRYAAGVPVHFTLTLTNQSSLPCNLPSNCQSPTDRSAFIVTVSESGAEAEIWRAAYFRPCTPHVLAPGESFSSPMVWCQEINGGNGTGLDPTSACDARSEAPSAGPGQYTGSAYWHTDWSGSGAVARGSTSFSVAPAVSSY